MGQKGFNPTQVITRWSKVASEMQTERFIVLWPAGGGRRTEFTSMEIEGEVHEKELLSRMSRRQGPSTGALPIKSLSLKVIRHHVLFQQSKNATYMLNFILVSPVISRNLTKSKSLCL